jgi:hypothetical protein
MDADRASLSRAIACIAPTAAFRRPGCLEAAAAARVWAATPQDFNTELASGRARTAVAENAARRTADASPPGVPAACRSVSFTTKTRRLRSCAARSSCLCVFVVKLAFFRRQKHRACATPAKPIFMVGSARTTKRHAEMSLPGAARRSDLPRGMASSLRRALSIVLRSPPRPLLFRRVEILRDRKATPVRRHTPIAAPPQPLHTGKDLCIVFHNSFTPL